MEEAKFHERNSNAFDKRYFPSHVRKALQKLEPNLQKDIIAGFDRAGIFPLNRKRVLDRLPPELCEDEDVDGSQANSSTSVNDSLTTFLKEMRYGLEEEPPLLYSTSAPSRCGFKTALPLSTQQVRNVENVRNEAVPDLEQRKQLEPDFQWWGRQTLSSLLSLSQ
ncbi:hypothetical protein J6590_102374 [Homalodisca vitripennis]|nr:hypothetical protein J6590_102374 [Homalodisca vitripennis]